MPENPYQSPAAAVAGSAQPRRNSYHKSVRVAAIAFAVVAGFVGLVDTLMVYSGAGMDWPGPLQAPFLYGNIAATPLFLLVWENTRALWHFPYGVEIPFILSSVLTHGGLAFIAALVFHRMMFGTRDRRRHFWSAT
jgi:hypothetical protein